jgi:hypothetical protein
VLSDAAVEIIGPSANSSGILFIEKQGFNPLFKAVNLANRSNDRNRTPEATHSIT